VKNVDRSKREFALPSIKTVSPWGDVPTRAANCVMDIPGLRTLIRHSRESGPPRRTDARQRLIPVSKKQTMTNPTTPAMKGR
jgi:hypothetical protein